MKTAKNGPTYMPPVKSAKPSIMQRLMYTVDDNEISALTSCCSNGDSDESPVPENLCEVSSSGASRNDPRSF
jgi:hypothetical protein